MSGFAIFIAFTIIGILYEIMRAVQHIGESPEERKERLENERTRRERIQPWAILFTAVMLLGCILGLSYLDQVMDIF